MAKGAVAKEKGGRIIPRSLVWATGVGIIDTEAKRRNGLRKTIHSGWDTLNRGALTGYPPEGFHLRACTPGASLPGSAPLHLLFPPPEGAPPCPMSRFQAQCRPTGWPSPLPLSSLSQHLIVFLCAMDHGLYSLFVSVGDDLVNVSPSSLASELHQGRGHVFLVPFCVHRA